MNKQKPKVCKAPGCEVEFIPTFSTTQKVCSPLCAIELDKAKKQVKREKETRVAVRKLNEASLSWQHKQTQKVFNKFIRIRDHGQCCISCGRNSGAKINAGHFRSVGAAPHLRYNEDNVHLQCEHCNTYLHGNIKGYVPGLIEKIGIERFEAIEADNTPRKYTIYELVAIRTHYAQKTKELTAKLESEAL